MSPKSSESGLTLFEVSVGLVIAGLLLVVLVRLFKDSHRAVDMQEQLADRDQTLQYVCKRLGDRLMDAGTNLPDSGWPVISTLGQKDTVMRLSFNPYGGIQPCDTTRNRVRRIPIDDAKAFRGAGKILAVYAKGVKKPEILHIDTGFNAEGFERGVKDTQRLPDTLQLTAANSFAAGDILYTLEEEVYRLQDGNLMLGSEILAEGVDSLRLQTFDRYGKATTNWPDIRSVTIRMTARTVQPQPGTGGNRYHPSTRSLSLRLRNRF